MPYVRRKKEVPANPMVWPLAVSIAAVFAIAGVGMLSDLEIPVNGLLVPLLLACLLSLVGYTGVAIRLGWIAAPGHLGQVHHFQRRKLPVAFWLIAAFYLGASLPVAWYLTGRLIMAA